MSGIKRPASKNAGFQVGEAVPEIVGPGQPGARAWKGPSVLAAMR
ncbi:MAG: hypothetical protein U1F56_16910 [Rubrivivax sp.]